jgi:hypothetical protein
MKQLNRVAIGLVAALGMFVSATFYICNDVALASENAVETRVPDHELEVLWLPHTLPQPVLDVEVLAALEYWNPRALRETLRPWAHAIVEAAPKRQDAIWLASQASVESKFIDVVLSFRCNDGDYRMCDHGHAVGPWQMQDKKMLHAAPLVQAKRAIEWMRRSPQAWTTWKAARSQADAWLAAR